MNRHRHNHHYQQQHHQMTPPPNDYVAKRMEDIRKTMGGEAGCITSNLSYLPSPIYPLISFFSHLSSYLPSPIYPLISTLSYLPSHIYPLLSLF